MKMGNEPPDEVYLRIARRYRAGKEVETDAVWVLELVSDTNAVRYILATPEREAAPDMREALEKFVALVDWTESDGERPEETDMTEIMWNAQATIAKATKEAEG